MKGIIWHSNYINEETLDSLKRNGEPSLIVDYNNAMIVKSIGLTTVYPVYLVNNTNQDLIISSQSSHSHLNRQFYSNSSNEWMGFSRSDTMKLGFNCGCCFSYYFLKPNHFSIFLFDKSAKGQKHIMRVQHFDGFESETFYGKFDTTLTVKMIRSDGTWGLVDSVFYNKYLRKYQGDPGALEF